MSKYSKIWFAGAPYGESQPTNRIFKNSINRIQLGIWVRKQFGKRIIFRVRHGNGMYASILGKLYQDKYKYVVPSSINNAEGQPARDALSTAVSNWKTVLSDAVKAQWRKYAAIKGGTTGYAEYVGNYIKENV